MEFEQIRSTISNTITALVLGYGASLGITFESAMTAVENPDQIDWRRTGAAVVEVAFQVNKDITPYVEGPVNDFVMGARDSLIENSKTIDLSKIQPKPLQ